MNKRALIAGFTLVFSIGFCSVVLGADEPLDQSGQDTQDGRGDSNELLMFFEEQDLVTATKRPTSLRKAPAIATIITADEMKDMGARYLLDVLKMVPGLGISINEFGTFMIEVRGIRTALSEKVLVMIDGHSLNRNINGSALVYNVASKLPVENIRQVEVVRGPGSALYGNSAFVATINVVTRNAEEINGLELKGGGGSFDSYKANAVGGKTIGEKLSVSASADHYQTQGPKLYVQADALTGEPFSLAPGRTDLRSRHDDFFLKIGYGDLSFKGHYLTKKERLNIGLAHALTEDAYNDIDNYWGELAYAMRLSDRISANVKAYYDYYEQDPFAKIYPNGFTIPATLTTPALVFPSGMIGKPLVKNRTIGGELQIDWDLFKDNHLIAGVSYEVLRQYDVRQLANFDPLTLAPQPFVQEVANWNRDATRQIWALYLQDEWQLLEQFNLTAGVRYDHYSDFGDTVNPRVGLVWNFLEDLDLKLLFGQAFRAPNFSELYNSKNIVLVGNPNLKPERITTYEAGLAWRFNRYVASSLSYFYSVIDDLITKDSTTTPPRFANIGKAETQGVEVGLNGAFGPEIYWKINYTWQDPRDADTDRRLPFVPAHRISGSINYAPVRYLNLHTDVLWTGPRPRPAGDFRPEVPDYTTVDLAITLKNLYKTLEIQGTVRNIFDKRYSDPDTSGAQRLVPGDFPREGISWFLTASFKF